MIFKKYLKLAVVTGALAAMMVVPAFAAKKTYDFDLLINDGNTARSAPNIKDDDEQTAYVYTTDGNISSSDYFTMQIIAPTSDEAYSYSQRITSNSGRYLFEYNTYVGKQGRSRILAVTHKYDVWVTGYWYS